MKALLVLIPAAVALVAAGCGGTSAPDTASTAAVHTARTALGTVLVDSRGRTLYLFERDRGPSSSCYGACAGLWPPLTTAGPPTPGAGVRAPELRFSRRTDGRRIVTYFGHPLYTYAGDQKPGDAKGQGVDQFGAEWYALAPSGKTIEDD